MLFGAQCDKLSHSSIMRNDSEKQTDVRKHYKVVEIYNIIFSENVMCDSDTVEFTYHES